MTSDHLHLALSNYFHRKTRCITHPTLESLLPGLDLDGIPAGDKVMFGFGYLTAKMGVPPDPYEPNLEYGDGYDLGRRVASFEVLAPDWDIS